MGGLVRRSSDDARGFWLGHVEAQGASGVSVAGYCRERGLCAASFYVWRKRLGREAGGAAAGFCEIERQSAGGHSGAVLELAGALREARGGIEVTAVRVRLNDAGQLGEALRALGQL